MRNRRRHRGQALVETAYPSVLFVGLLLLLIGIGRWSVLIEREYSALRYNSVIASLYSPDQDNHPRRLYENLRGVYHKGSLGATCHNADTGAITATTLDGGPGKTGLYNPVISGSITSCPGTVYITGNPSGEPLLILLGTTTTIKSNNISSASSLTSSITQIFSNFTTRLPTVTATMFRGGDLQSMLRCYPDINRVISNSLDPLHDTNNNYSAANIPLISGDSGTKLAVNGSC